jgi:hypothetical protein
VTNNQDWPGVGWRNSKGRRKVEGQSTAVRYSNEFPGMSYELPNHLDVTAVSWPTHLSYSTLSTLEKSAKAAKI